MSRAFLGSHISLLLQRLIKLDQPMDLILSQYFRKNKFLGSKDRKTIGETLYQIIRHLSLFQYLARSESVKGYLEIFQKTSWEEQKENPLVPEHVRLSVPKFFLKLLEKQYGSDQARKICQILNQNAPTTIRVNALKITPDKLLELWNNRFEVAKCAHAKCGLQFAKREPLFSLEEFKSGLFEMQDEGSQLLSDLIDVKPKEHFLDYCSGSGGKTLAIAPQMGNSGQIYLHDIRPSILNQARKRLKRAGVQNVQFCLPKKPVDWVLADVPCSGTGTLRRNPDAKWKLSYEMVDRLVQLQKEIVKEALEYLKVGGKFVYATCSILRQENEDQVDYLLKNFPLKLCQEPTAFLPQENGMDGFFAAVFEKTGRCTS